MNKSLFAQYVAKWFAVLAKTFVEKTNDSKNPVTYLFKTMLRQELSADGNWTSGSASKSIVAADLVDIDSPLPLKKRDALSKATGEIPMLGMRMYKSARLIQQIKYLAATGATEQQIVKTIFDDLARCITGVYERLEMMFLQALSTGVVLVEDDKNIGTGIRLDFGYRDTNKYGATVKWGNAGYTPISDIERVLTAARENADIITTIALDKAAYNQMRRSDEAKALYAASIGNYTGNSLIVPTPSQFDAIMADEYKVQMLVIDRAVRYEKDGKQTVVKPFAENTLVFLPTLQVGSLVYALLAEQDAEHRVAGVEYQVVDNYILASKYSTNAPLQEFTSTQSLALPVIENVDSIYVLNTQEAQEVAAGEVEGDANITVYGQTLVKVDVIAALNAIGVRTANNISDVKLIEKINELSDEQEALLKTALGV